LEFGNARSLFKLYFTSAMRDYRETTEESSCMKFAKEFLPVLDMALTTAEPNSESEAAGEADAPKT
jgi:hypothetical protein